MPNKINAAHILVKNDVDANYVYQKLKAGANFATLAQEYSQCPSRKRGGDLGWFGRGQMVKEFDKACFSGKKGDLIGPVKTQFGYHIIKIIDTK